MKGTYTYEYPRPMLTADCVVVRHRAEVLLVRRGNEPYKGCWALPGGFMEMDETIEHCAVRELQEETDLIVGEEGLKTDRRLQRSGTRPSRTHGDGGLPD